MSEYRVRTEPDDIWDMDQLKGDCFNPEVCTSLSAEELRENELKFEEMVDSDGVWGYIIEKQCPHCGSWMQIDSCWGFVGEDFALEEGQWALKHLREEQR